MQTSFKIDALHVWFRQNRWLWLFTIFTRLSLALGFIFPGIVKIKGERFTDLSNNHPMGHYLEALFHTGYYYPFISVMQVLAGVLLLIPRTVLLGVMIYFPIILNICILSWAVRFDGSLFNSTLMVIACLYLLWWNYDRIKYLLPFHPESLLGVLPRQKMETSFPFLFFISVALTFMAVLAVSINLFDVRPNNTLLNCTHQFEGSNRTEAGKRFCDCIHLQGQPLDKCLEEYKSAPDDPKYNLKQS